MEETSAISLKNIWQAIRLHWGIMLCVSLLLFGGIAAFVLSLNPAYTADALVLLAPVADELAANPTDRNFAITDPMFVRSETAILQSDEICRDVIQQLHLDTLPEFHRKPGIREMLGLGAASGPNPFLTQHELELDGVLRMYQAKLTVFNDGRNKTVDIGFTASDPRLAAKIANAHAQAYLRAQGARRTGSEQQAIAWLKSEVDNRAKEMRDADALVQQYQLKSGIVGTRDATVIEQRLQQLNTQLVDAQRQLSTQTSLLNVIRDIREGADPSRASSLVQSDSFNDLLRNRVQAESTVASLETRLAPNHPTLVKARQDLASINNVLDKELRRMENEARGAVASASRQVDDLTQATHREALSKVDQDRLAAGLPALISEAQVKRTVFETVLNHYQTRLAESAFLAPAATVVSRAEPSATPSFPKTPLLLAIGMMLAVFGGACSALVVHLFRPASLDLDEVADALGIQPLVAIPRYRNASRESGVVKMKDPRLFIESIRSVRNAIFEQQDRRNTKTCLLTSMRAGQGKSLVAMSLARALARGGARTLFLEMDLRCPNASALARREPPLRGMGAVLEGRASFGDVVVRDENTGLDMLFAEQQASSAVDQLTALKFAALVAKLRTHYDAIIIDSPPIGLVSDALTIAPLVDQTVMIAKDGEASTAELARGTRLLKDRGATVAGLVLTGVDPKGFSRAHDSTLKRYMVGVPGQRDETAELMPSMDVIRPAANR
ncbi:MAG: polysaccharide biosynthesis transport protein [Gammaproteobacteria bacterium]|jgi:capsular exopolysaccharide synthesis family protein|nr:polysaccharide biosynthesis transport protein [Gammaproteobacteria bacterium]